MKLTVAQAIIKCLEKEEIDVCFGLTGSHLLALFNALKDSKIKYYSVKHECAAGFMALNYTKVSQKPALIVATAGPGAANLINSVAELYKCQIPAIIITPIVSTLSFGKIAFQEDSGYGTSYSVIKVMSCVTKHSLLAINAQMIPAYIRELFRFALTPPYGPVHLGVPVNLFTEEIEIEDISPSQYRFINDERIEYNKIKKVLEYIKNSQKPVLLIGNRCIYPDCSDALINLIDKFNLPFILTHASKGILDETHKMFGGILDYFGHRSAEKFAKESDLIISFGMDFSESETIKYDKELFKNAKIISFDNCELFIGVNYPVEMAIIGSLPLSINTLINFLDKANYKSNYIPEKFNEDFKIINKHQIEEANKQTNPMTIYFLFNEISELLEDSVVFMDQSAIGCSSVRYFVAKQRNYFTSPTGYSIAQSVSGVVGGKIALPQKQVFCITGDGAFLMHGAEVLTAVQYNLGITWIIFKEDYYNMIQINQNLAYGGSLEFCAKIKNPDYKFLAQAYYCDYYEVNTLQDLQNAIKDAKENNLKNKCTLIIINYDYEQHLPIKPQLVQTMKDLGQTKDIKSNPYLMKAFSKALKEKV